ncbi:sensor histidine kinase [Flavobacterium sp.]|uniref:ATP-binding protein n=1 Tax=Flavobacterium sp. TaxID=239 RepID=UPI0025E0135C|nr:sensor histidine kinase [Flavobacterium sp.]
MKINRVKIVALAVVFFCTTAFSLALNPNLEKFKNSFEKLDFNTRITILKKVTLNTLSDSDKATYYQLYGQTFYLENKGDQAIAYFMKAMELYKKETNYTKATELGLTIAEIKRLSDYKYEDFHYLLDDAVVYAKKTNNTKLLCSIYKEIASNFIKTNPKKAIAYFILAKEESQKEKDSLFAARLDSNIGLVYNEFLHQPKTARIYCTAALHYFQKKKLSYYLASTYINMAGILRDEKKPDSAMMYYQKAELLDVKEYQTNFKIALYTQMSETYKELKDYKKAYEYSEKQKVYQNINNEQEIVKAIRDIDAKYQTKENKLQITSLKNTMDKGGKVIIFLLITIVLFFLSYQNMRRKKKIAEQEKLIQTQKIENILQEQELHEIDKLIEGQEKERILIANELHDNLGSLLATLKLNFQNLKLRKTTSLEADEQLFTTTDALLEEAYQKVRTLAHKQNAGVIGNQGLVPAVQNMASKIALSGKITVQVIPFGLDERLENTLELTIFRMIQELLTNAVKHAHATEIIINLTQHEDTLNIIVEDNGNGFDVDQIDKKDGMGLPNIEKKVTQLQGTFSIDSSIGRGTTLIIDLPL